MVHDWFVHKKGAWAHTHDIPLDDGDSWHERPMRVPKTPADPPKVADSKRPPAYINENTHWWDGSHVYGSTPVSAGVAPRRTRRQGAGQPERPARRRSGHRPGDHRLHRERLGGPEPAARAVRARAQRDLRRAEEAQPALGRRAAVPAGASRQRGAAREDPHRGVVDGDPPEPTSPRPACGPTGTAAFSKLQNVFPKLADNDIFSGHSRARRPSTTARRSR